MAEQLRKEGRFRQALRFYIEVSYLDANGPMNRGGVSDPELLKKYPPFDPELALQAPAIVNSIKTLASKQSMSKSDTKKLYIEVASEQYQNLKLPVDPQIAWKSVLSEMK